MKERAIRASVTPQTFVLFGASGAGKTSLAVTAPRPIVLDTNKGLLSVAGKPGLEHVRAVDVSGMDELDQAYDNFLGTGTRDWRKKFDTMIVDHFDDIQSLIFDELGEKRNKKRSGSDPDEIEQREWGVMATKLKRYVRKMKSVPIHKIFICGEQEDRETGIMVPSLQGNQMKTALPYLSDHILYLRVGKNGTRYLHLDPTEEYFAKTRAHWLETRKFKIDNNDPKALTKIFELIAAGPKGVQKSGKTTTEGK